MNSKHIWPLAAIILTVMMWGLSFLSIKVSVAVLPPMTLALIRFSMASVLLAIVFKRKESGEKLDKKDIPIMLLGGILGVSLYFYFENNGVKLISASAASIIIATTPVITLVAEVIFLKSPITKRKIVSVLLSVVGVYYVVGGNFKELLSSTTSAGYRMMLGAVFAWVAYTIITKPLFERYSQLAVVYYQTVFGTLTLIPFAIYEETPWHLITIKILLNVTYLGVFCSAIAYYLYVYAMDKLGVSITSLYLNLVPVVTVAASYIILDERIRLHQIWGGLLVIAAVYIVNWQGRKKQADIRQEIPSCVK